MVATDTRTASVLPNAVRFSSHSRQSLVTLPFAIELLMVKQGMASLKPARGALESKKCASPPLVRMCHMERYSVHYEWRYPLVLRSILRDTLIHTSFPWGLLNWSFTFGVSLKTHSLLFQSSAHFSCSSSHSLILSRICLQTWSK